MNLCNDDHEEVCYEGRNCPVCHMRDTKNDDIKERDDTITNLETRVTELEEELESKAE